MVWAIVGQKPYALAELKQVFLRQGEWDVNIPAGTAWNTLGKANLLLAMKPVSTATTQIKGKIIEYLDALLDAQLPDGSWASNDSSRQLTAYAVMALDAYASTPAIKQAVSAGVNYLLSTQLGNGGFDDGSGAENTEVNSEVLQALKATR